MQGANPGSIEILDITDPEVAVTFPEWFNRDGCGCVLTSKSGAFRVVLCCRQSGTLNVKLKGLDVRDHEGGRIPFWIDYHTFWVNEEKIFDQIHTVCHDKPFAFSKDVRAQEIVSMFVEWEPHDERLGKPKLNA